ncbi:hypothetical protein DFH07DRAFT_863365 [Mycena maculata]|uniref:Uncharacterized protein n=1 Tax=Mycena maculata TaxID=230809 RepID=A0AAD7MFR4_9AGAR|nr:hypothetical protein DFH07DRAFT_863365 [Mycena maculata]
MFRPMQSSRAEMVASTLVAMSVDGILVLRYTDYSASWNFSSVLHWHRVWLLYGKSRRLIYILIPLLIGYISLLPPLLNGCYSLTVPRLFTYYALPYFLMAILMFSMTAYKCAKHLRRTGRFSQMPVVTLFSRDGVFLFLTIMLYSIVEIIIWSSTRASLAQVPVIIPAVVGARILLNIKNLASEVNADAVPATELTTLSRSTRRQSLAANVRIPWHLRTGEVGNSTEMSRRELLELDHQ